MSKLHGSCLCEAVEFELADDFEFAHLCHCIQCQKATGTAHASNFFTAPGNLRWLRGEELVRRYDVPGRTISSAFCSRCGANLPYASKSGRHLVVPAGSLDGPPRLRPERHIFYQERMPWWEETHDLERWPAFPPGED